MKPKLTAVKAERPTSSHINEIGSSEKTKLVPKSGIDIAPIVFPIPKTKIHLFDTFVSECVKLIPHE